MKRLFRNLTVEHKQKISNSLKGRKHSDEWKSNISIGLKRHWSSIERIDDATFKEIQELIRIKSKNNNKRK